MTTSIDNHNPPAVYEWTGPTGEHFRDVRSEYGTYYHDTTSPEVVRILDNAMRSGARLRLFYGDTKTGKDWGEENNVVGTISRSMGPIKIAILIASARSCSGGAILTDCIVRIMSNGREIYRVPNYQLPQFEVQLINPADMCGKVNLYQAGYTHGVWRDGANVANFKSMERAQRYIDFIQGKRMNH